MPSSNNVTGSECSECIHEKVCSYKKAFTDRKRELSGYLNQKDLDIPNDLIWVTVKCSEYRTASPILTRSVIDK